MKKNTFIIIFCVLSIMFGFVSPAAAEPAGDITKMDIFLTELNNGDYISLTGLYSSANLEIPIPSTYTVTGENWLLFNVSPSQQVDLERSSLTISLNDHLLVSYRLKEFDGREKQVVLPAEYFKRGNNTLSFTAMLHLPDDNETTCSNWDDPSRWLTLSTGSTLHLVVSPNEQQLDLSTFPQSFISPIDRFVAGQPVNTTTFVLPDSPSNDDLTSMAALSYQFGKQAGQNFPWQPMVLNETAFDPEAISPGGVVLVRSLAGQVNASTADRDQLILNNSPWNPVYPMLFVDDIQPTDGFTPVALLADPVRRVSLQGNQAYFDPGAISPPEAYQNAYTLEDLGYLDRTVRGIGEASLIYRLFVPYDLTINGAMLRMIVSHSPDLDMNNSSILIYLNGYTVASIAPTARSASFEPIDIDLPAKRLRPGVNFIRLTFDLHIPYSSCERAPESVWATVNATSELQMNFRETDRVPELSYFPMPFSDYPGFAFIIPDQPDASLLENIARMAFRLGQDAQLTNQTPVVIRARDFDPNNTSFVNFILVGLPTDNPILMQINRSLPQPFTENGKGIEPGYGIYLPTNDENAPIGLAQILVSPWNSDGVLMVVTGTDAESLEWTWDTLLDQTREKEFKGNVMVVGAGARLADGSLGAPQVLFEDTPDVARLPLVGNLLQQLKPDDVFPAVVGVQTAIILLFGILYFIRRSKDNE